MAELTLLIGERASCAASFQIWLAMREVGLLFQIRSAAVSEPRHADELCAGKLPVLLVDEVPIWEPLAIGEFLAEHVPNLWPTEPRARALARSVAFEAQSGLRAIQTLLPFDVTRRFATNRLVGPVRNDLDRITTLWQECRVRFRGDGPFLFGRFSLADAVHASLALRLIGHSIELPAEAGVYLETITTLPAVSEWIEAARHEQTRSLQHRAPTGTQRPCPAGEVRPGPLESTVPATTVEPGGVKSSEGEPAVKPIGAGTRRRH